MSARQGIHTDDLAPPRNLDREDLMRERDAHREVLQAALDQVAELRATLSALHDSFSAVERNDHTPRYRYTNVDDPDAITSNRDGYEPPKGRRWFTPREIAAVAKREIEEAISA